MEDTPPVRELETSPSQFAANLAAPTKNNQLPYDVSAAALSTSLKRLTMEAPLSAASSGPSPILGSQTPTRQTPVSTPHKSLRRTSSSMIGEQRLSTPKLTRKSSMSSLHSTGDATSPRSIPSRRSSCNLLSPPPSVRNPRSSIPSQIDEPTEPKVDTAISVANSHFRRELQFHEQFPTESHPTKTVVVIQDSCYGHRYSRPRTSKANLSTIVERPERIHASLLGVSAAYVCLGGRHAEGKCKPQLKPDSALTSKIPFRIYRSSRSMDLASPAVTNIHGTKWMEELKIMCNSAEAKLASNEKELVRPFKDGEPLEEGRRKLHEGDLYLCSDSLEALQGAVGGVCDGVDAVFSESGALPGPSRAFVCIRPPGHHCSANYPSGFCWLNNVHVGISYASMTHGLTHAAIIDFDLHHGDGSQAIAWEHNAKMARLPKNVPIAKRPAIGYFSLHDINSYPCEMGDEEKVRNASLCIESAHGQSIWNVHLQPWKVENEFWSLYEHRYSVLIDKARAFLRTHTDRLTSSPNSPHSKAVIFLSAGFDASEWESPGMQRHKVSVPTDFYARLTRDVVKLAEEEGLGVDGRVISVLEGGYSDRALTSGVLSHLCGLVATHGSALPTEENGLRYEMSKQKDAPRSGNGGLTPSSEGRDASFDPSWWSLPRLEQLEKAQEPSSPTPAIKKTGYGVRPCYTTSTQSFTAKTVPGAVLYRSVSGQGAIGPSSSTFKREPTPPIPEVDWATATHELSKLLIPSDRQTQSCKPEELNAVASRARRERHSTIGPPTAEQPIEGKRMQLRARKSKAPSYVVEEEDEGTSAGSRVGRRKTIAEAGRPTGKAPSHLDHSSERHAILKGRSRRRLSVATKVTSVHGDAATMPRASTAMLLADELPPEMHSAGMYSSNNGSNKEFQQTGHPPMVSNSSVKPVKANGAKKKSYASSDPSLQSSIEVNASNRAPMATTASDKLLAPNEAMRIKDVDNIASSMKKMSIKLNVPPKEEQEARERTKLGGIPITKLSKRNGTSGTTKSATEAANPQGVSFPDEPIPWNSGPTNWDMERAGIDGMEVVEGPAETQMVPRQHDLTPTSTATLLQHQSSDKRFPLLPQCPDRKVAGYPKFVPYTAAETESPPPMEQETLVWLPPNTSTPSTMKISRRDLPVFTANSTIPFGGQNTVAPIQASHQQSNSAVEETIGTANDTNGM